MDNPAPVQNKTLNQSVVVNDGLTTPSFGLFQTPFDLSDADFLRLQQPNPTALAAGGAVLAFGVSYGLPLAAKFIVQGEVPASLDWKLTIGLIVLGLLLVGASWMFSGPRRDVIRRINAHFKSNPVQKQVQIPGQKK
jgi:hypothetical protein